MKLFKVKRLLKIDIFKVARFCDNQFNITIAKSSITSKMPGYRLQGKGIFLTYPQCPASREAVRDMIESKGLTIVKGLIAQEEHKSGDKHLHAYVKFDKPINTVNPRYFDIEFENKAYHGKYEPAKSAIGSIKYISKADPSPLELGDMDYEQEMQAKAQKKKILGKRLAAGEPLQDIIDDGN